ncbi:hypothetical protein B0H14DRAFT_3582689 [Mycena olivaceomarginata]|nr:hypothetical protein B0H14DRAFT_3582689 [Mycena olivaceomarginata]
MSGGHPSPFRPSLYPVHEFRFLVPADLQILREEVSVSSSEMTQVHPILRSQDATGPQGIDELPTRRGADPLVRNIFDLGVLDGCGGWDGNRSGPVGMHELSGASQLLVLFSLECLASFLNCQRSRCAPPLPHSPQPIHEDSLRHSAHPFGAQISKPTSTGHEFLPIACNPSGIAGVATASSNVGRSNGESGRPPRRDSHNAVEARRRHGINEAIRELAGLLPPKAEETGGKIDAAPIGVILKESVEYIRSLQQLVNAQVVRRQELERELQLLTLKDARAWKSWGQEECLKTLEEGHDSVVGYRAAFNTSPVAYVQELFGFPSRSRTNPAARKFQLRSIAVMLGNSPRFRLPARSLPRRESGLEHKGPKPVWESLESNYPAVRGFSQPFDAIVVATGRYNAPNIPNISGLEEWATNFPGSIIHSRQYRRPQPFVNETVLVVGGALSGVEIMRETAWKVYQSLRVEHTMMPEGRVRTPEATDWGAGIPAVNNQSREIREHQDLQRLKAGCCRMLRREPDQPLLFQDPATLIISATSAAVSPATKASCDRSYHEKSRNSPPPSKLVEGDIPDQPLNPRKIPRE